VCVLFVVLYHLKMPAKFQREKNADRNKRCGRKHFLVNFIGLRYILATFLRPPWYICLYSVLLLFVDIILRNRFRNFLRLFADHVLNKAGLLGYYIDMMLYCQESICSGKMSSSVVLH